MEDEVRVSFDFVAEFNIAVDGMRVKCQCAISEEQFSIGCESPAKMNRVLRCLSVLVIERGYLSAAGTLTLDRFRTFLLLSL